MKWSKLDKEIVFICVFLLSLVAITMFACFKNTVFVGKSYDIYVLTDIRHEEFYKKQHSVLMSATENDTVYVHLAGSGGFIDGMVFLQNAMLASKAEVIAVVDGSVSSAHAVLAVTPKRIIINGETLVLLHGPSTMNMTERNCAQSGVGYDRGLLISEKCYEDSPKIDFFVQKVMRKYVAPILTVDELKLYQQGHNIILSQSLFISRLKQAGKQVEVRK